MAPRKNIIKLGKKMCAATSMMIKFDENAPEYYSLDPIVNDEMAEVALAMELRDPLPIEKIAEKCGKSVEKTLELAHQLALVGACTAFEKDGVELFELEVFVPGAMERMVTNENNITEYPQIARSFEHYARDLGSKISHNMPIGVGPMKVIPIQSALDGESRVAEAEELSYYIEKNTLFAVSDCSCRKVRRVMGEGCGHLEQDMCIHMGKNADYYMRTGRARQIEKKEVYEIIKKAEENGLMHQIPNFSGEGEALSICNCCACSCLSMRNAVYFNSPDMVRSNYVAEVNTDNCVACGQCVENCPTNALKLGQKLCSENPIKHQDSPSPRDHVWGKKHWNVNYRENRKDVVETGTAPCKTECPAHIAVQGYIKLAAQGRYTEALELIKKENPLPAVCGRICPHKCEDACTRGDLDNPVAIDEIKKFIADQDMDSKTRFIPQKKNDYGKKMAIVGSGPAGLACAYYLALDGYKVTVFEKQKKLGGMLTLGIPAFRLEKDVIEAEIEVLREMGVEFKTGVEVGKDVTLSELRKQKYEAFYLAIGAQGARNLGIEGEDAKGVIAGVDFLRNVALNKADKLKGNVVVIGGGNVAIDVARTATRVGGKDVQMYCLEARDEMPALDEEIEEAEAEAIKINNGWGPKRIVVEKGKVTGVEFKKCVSVFDEEHRFNPKYDENNTKIVKADFVLLSIGQSIEWGNLLNETTIELNRNQTIKADDFTYATTEKDIFVGGDAFTGPKFAINAIAAGKEGAISMHRSVWPGQSLTIGRDRRQYHSLDKKSVIVEGYDNTSRQRPLHKKENEKTFKDTRATFTEEQLKKETERCLGCGAVVIDQNMCVGCGQCTTNCKFDAIKLVKKYNKKGATFEKLPVLMGFHMAGRAGKIPFKAVKDVFTGSNK